MDRKLLRGNIKGEGWWFCYLDLTEFLLKSGWADHMSPLGVEGGEGMQNWGAGRKRKRWWRMRILIRYWGDQGVG